MTEEQLQTIAGGFTAMMEKCCKQSDVDACLGEEVLSISFFKKTETKNHTHTHKKTPKPKKPKLHIQEPGNCALESGSANCYGHLSVCPYNKCAELNVYLGCTDYSH